MSGKRVKSPPSGPSVNYFCSHPKNSLQIATALKAYHKSEKEVGIPEPYGPLPIKFGQIKNVVKAVAEGEKLDETKTTAEGEWARQDVLFKRIKQVSRDRYLYQYSNLNPALPLHTSHDSNKQVVQ